MPDERTSEDLMPTEKNGDPMTRAKLLNRVQELEKWTAPRVN